MSHMSEMRLFDPSGNRLYLNAKERAAFLKSAATYDPETQSFAEMLAFTGCRISEALEIVPKRLDVDGKMVIFRSLKKRREDVFRAVPVPPDYMDNVQRTFSIRQAQKRKNAATERLWPWHRQHGWRLIKSIMKDANITPGGIYRPRACATPMASMRFLPAFPSPSFKSGWDTPSSRQRLYIRIL